MAATGPFKIVLWELEQSSPDVLGNPAADRVRVELARLFNLDEQMASSIVSAIPIVILDGLDGRSAGVVRERLQVLAQAGCHMRTTDEPADTMPRVNWPEDPAIAQVSDERSSLSDEVRAAGPAGGSPGASLSCPSCGVALQLTTAGATSGARSHAHAGSPSTHAASQATQAGGPAVTGARSSPRDSAAEQADWMSPPVSRLGPPAGGSAANAPAPETPARSGSRRFDDASLLAYRRAAEPDGEPEASGARGQPTLEPELDPTSPDVAEQLEVTFSDSSDQLEAVDASAVAIPSTVTTEGLRPTPHAFAPKPGRSKGPDLRDDPFDDPFGEDDEDELVSDGFPTEPPKGRAPATRPDRSDLSDIDELEDLEELSGSGVGLHDSGSDILDMDPPHRKRSKKGLNPFQDDLDLLDDELGQGSSGSGGRRSSSELEPVDDFDLLEDEPRRSSRGASTPAHAPARGERTRGEARRAPDPLDLLADSDELDPPPAPAARGRREPDLDEVLRMFGPDDERPLDDMSGLEPAPLDLSPREARAGGRDVFDDEISDLLEPLNPSEAMEILKSQRGKREPDPGGPGSPFESLDAEDADSLDLFGGSDAGRDRSRSAGRAKKKTRGVPFPASDEDLGLFEESRGGRPRGSSPPRKRTDPFARARKAMEDEQRPREEREPAHAASSERNGRSTGSRKSSPPAASKPASGKSKSDRTGPPPSGGGEHGLVLSRISDPDKKDKAAELIAEIKGCSVDDASRLTDRTIIPVLKGVSREVAEFHLDKFKRYKIAGRVTTRQRS